MFRAWTAQQSLGVERRAVAEGGVSLAALMREAGASVARELSARVPDGEVVVLCGPGNNGGDGWVAARELLHSGRAVRVVSLRDPGELSGIAAEAASDAIAAGVPWMVPSLPPSADDLMSADVVVDALLGTGSGLPLRDPLGAWCEAVNACGAYIVSVDGPTGVDLSSGAAAENAIAADCTVSFTAPKLGLVTYPGASYAGELVIADIGVPDEYTLVDDAPEIWLAEQYAQLLPMPAPDAHKNQRGRVLVIAGSGFFPGAAILAARGAMRAGAGYVTLAVPDPIVAVAQAHLLSAPVVGLPASGRVFSSAAAAAARDLATEYDAVVLGPGMTVADGAAATARRLVSAIDRPLVLDADGLNAFVDHVGLIEQRSAPTVLTPHPGELGRLLSESVEQVQANRIGSATRLAGASRTVVLKGAGTVVSGAGRCLVNTSGSVALATAGTGDVLSGVVGAFLAQGLPPFEAAALAVYVHGRAGESAARALTPLSVIADDIPDHLPSAMAELLEDW